jgi:hypothetical protein
MASQNSARRRRPVSAAVAAAVVLTCTVTACGPWEEDASASDPAASAQEPAPEAGGQDVGDGWRDRLPEDLPAALKDVDLEEWRKGGWKDWDQWPREATEFVNPYLPDHWKKDRMKEAEGTEETVPAKFEAASGTSSRSPGTVQAEPVPAPYYKNAAPAGKLFFETPEGPKVCSATVVKNPKKPGRSNLVATAGHCVHGGRGGGWYRNVMFVPAYNNKGLPASQLNSGGWNNAYPYGKWWVEWIQTTDYWIDGGPRGTDGWQGDFAVLKVRPNPKSGKSLQETVGTAVRVDFDTPPIGRFDGVSSYGYPAAPPYRGARMFQCTDDPSSYVLDPAQPPMYWIGCTMTGGMSGGGWFTTDENGESALVSVNSTINRPDVSWARGPRLGRAAEGVFDAVVKKFS